MSAGNKRTHHKQRQILRRKLEARGVPNAEIQRQVERLRQHQAAARAAGVNPNDLDVLWNETHAALRLDDRGFKPRAGDPLLRGAGRATGNTAKAVSRRKTYTAYELRENHG